MTVKIRLKRTGRKKDPHYKVVAVDSRKKRDGSVLEYLGHYHPQKSFPNLTVDLERYEGLKRKGAQVSDTVRTLINKLQRDFVEKEKSGVAPEKQELEEEAGKKKEDLKKEDKASEEDIDQEKNISENEKEASPPEEEEDLKKKDKTSEEDIDQEKSTSENEEEEDLKKEDKASKEGIAEEKSSSDRKEKEAKTDKSPPVEEDSKEK